MTTGRVYLPTSLDRLTALRDERRLDGPLIAYAPTPALAAAVGGNPDEEELEYAATQEAATVAAALGDDVVAAVDIPSGELAEAIKHSGPPDSPAAVRLVGPVLLRQVVSLHRLDPPGQRDPDSDLELSWYDVTELVALLTELGGQPAR